MEETVDITQISDSGDDNLPKEVKLKKYFEGNVVNAYNLVAVILFLGMLITGYVVAVTKCDYAYHPPSFSELGSCPWARTFIESYAYMLSILLLLSTYCRYKFMKRINLSKHINKFGFWMGSISFFIFPYMFFFPDTIYRMVHYLFIVTTLGLNLIYCAVLLHQSFKMFQISVTRYQRNNYIFRAIVVVINIITYIGFLATSIIKWRMKYFMSNFDQGEMPTPAMKNYLASSYFEWIYFLTMPISYIINVLEYYKFLKR